jgi:hypothetical protein
MIEGHQMNAAVETSTARFTRSQTMPFSGAPFAMGSLSYIVPNDTLPFSYTSAPPEGTPWESGTFENCSVRVFDARRAWEKPRLESEGFELWDAPSQVSDFADRDAIKSTYYAEMAELALAVTGASRAYIFDHLVRRRDAERTELNFGRQGADGLPTANGRIHNDYTEASGRHRLGLVLPAAAEAAAVRRYAIVNLWRSIKGVVLDAPLAVCDARTVMARDLVEAELRYPKRKGEIYLAQRSAAHQWHYYPHMTEDEVLVFKQYDSQLSGVSRFTPHTAFEHPDTPADAPPRESIEVRCLVVFD